MNKRFVPLNEKIKHSRLMSGKTQREAAAELCITRSCLSNYESGVREPDINMLEKMAKAFDVEASYFLSDGTFLGAMSEADRQEYSKIQGKIRKVNNIINTEKMPLSSKIALHSFHEFLNFCDRRAKKGR